MFFYALTLATFNRCLGRTSDWNDEFWFDPEPLPYRGRMPAAKIAFAHYDDHAALEEQAMPLGPGPAWKIFAECFRPRVVL